MDFMTATVAGAMPTGAAALPPQSEEYRLPSQPAVKLISELMPSSRFAIRLTAQKFEISGALGTVIHDSMLGSFKHQYYL